MKVRVNKLRETLKVLQPAVAGRKATLPVTQNILVKEGRLSATNLELFISVALAEADGDAFTFPFAEMKDILAALPGYETVELEASANEVRLRTSHSAFTMEGLDAGEFPPEPGVEPDEVKVDGDAFVEALEALRPYAATEKDRPALTGIYVQFGDPAQVAAVDGFRLSWRSLPFAIQPLPDVDPLIIPATSVTALKSVWQAAPKPPEMPTSSEPPHRKSLDIARLAVAKRPIVLRFGAARLCCQFGDTRFTTQLLTGSFPDYKQLIPTGQEKRVVFEAGAFGLALRQLGHVGNVVQISWEERTMKIAVHAGEASSAESTISCSSQGGLARIAFNLRYLNDYFGGREGQVMLEVKDVKSPALFTYRGEPNMVLMPINAKWEEGPEGEPPQVNDEPQEKPEEKPKARRNRRKKGAVPVDTPVTTGVD